MARALLVVLLLTGACRIVHAQAAPPQAVRTPVPPAVDGRLNEEVWQQAPMISGFTQRDPNPGTAASERTIVHLIYDDAALYVGARLYDTAPDSIMARLGRRDAELEADAFFFFVDPYYDRRSGFYFGINAAGTRYDGVLYNDDWDDADWDGVWNGAVHVDERGWTAELRIPFSQLRFRKQDEAVWGINFRRDIARKKEQSYLVYVPRTESGFVSHFADLTGLQNLDPPRQVEVRPYVTARAEYIDVEAGNPFHDGSRYTPDVGADFKVGLTSNLTLNGTINPDFGQVEVDPAVVNLSDVETFFPEKRPFFIEGATVFNFGQGGANSNWGFNWSNPNFFYSRRIGRAPQGSLPDDVDYADVPDGTRILGATKLTGRIGGGWNVGTIQSVTARETAEVMQHAEVIETEVEPPAYYGIARSQREWNTGRHALGFISTITARDMTADRLRSEINQSAYVAGLDGWTFLDKERTWVTTGWFGLSHVRGSRERMINLQQSAQHYFQRPDADHVSVDSSRTSLTGYAGRVAVNKQRGNTFLNAALGVISPAFDINDLGFLWRADVINAHLAGGYKWTEQDRLTRRKTLYGALFRSWDFDGNTTWTGVWSQFWAQLTNFYEISFGGAVNPQTINSRRTRGGPLTLNPWGWELYGAVSTDGRRAWVFGTDFFTYQSDGGTSWEMEVEGTWKPASNLSLTVSPSFGRELATAQWVDAFDDPSAASTFGRRYVFADLDQITLGASVRMNWTFSPELSLQLYAQPLLSSGNYHHFKELARPRSFAFEVYDAARLTHDAGAQTYMADPDGAGPAAPFSFDDPDFNFKSLRGNVVLRWEYRPGSTLYLVWTQARSDREVDGRFRFDEALDRLWTAHPDNIFAVKITYWLGR